MDGEARIVHRRRQRQSLAALTRNERKGGTSLDIANHALGAEHQRGRLVVEFDVTARAGLAAETELVR
jgi:hypothetical protein